MSPGKNDDEWIDGYLGAPPEARERALERALTVLVPSPDYRMTPEQESTFRATRNLVEALRGLHVPLSDMYGSMLSAITREMRRDFGTKEAREILQGYVDTMFKASEGDR